MRLRSTWRSFDSSFERKGGLVTVQICVPCGRRFSNQFELVSETPAIKLAVSCNELHFARCCALKRTGIFALESKVMCLFYLILRSDVLMFRIPDINHCVNN